MKISLINNLYVFVAEESINRSIDSTEHATEKGLPLTDHVKRNPIELSISGRIIGENYKKTIEQLYDWQRSGTLVAYIGKNSFSNAIITSFDTEYTNTINDVPFSMSIKEIRISQKPVYTTVKVVRAPVQQVQQNNSGGGGNEVWHTVKKGDCVWNLLFRDYKGQIKNPNCNWVLEHNKSCFNPGFRQLIIGSKLLLGYRA